MVLERLIVTQQALFYLDQKAAFDCKILKIVSQTTLKPLTDEEVTLILATARRSNGEPGVHVDVL